MSKCHAYALHYDEEFRQLRTTGERKQAEVFLENYGLQATPLEDQPKAGSLLDTGSPYAELIEDLSLKYDKGERKPAAPHEQRALDILHNEEKITLAEIEGAALNRMVMKFDREIEFRKKQNEIKRHFEHFKSRLPVLEIHLIRRRAVQKAVDEMLASELKTGTVKRVLSTVRKCVNDTIKTHELNINNPFSEINIKGDGLDVTRKNVFTHEQLSQVKAFIRERSDRDTVRLLGLLVDTGTRCAEVGGILLEDIRLDHDIPHMVYRETSSRGIKSAAGERGMPLVGLSLEIAKMIKNSADDDQVYAFPQWIKGTELNKGSCNGAVNKALKGCIKGFTTHCFRHTMRDRLQEADVRGEIIDAICGWAGSGMQHYYGQTQRLEVLKNSINKALEREQRLIDKS